MVQTGVCPSQPEQPLRAYPWTSWPQDLKLLDKRAERLRVSQGSGMTIDTLAGGYGRRLRQQLRHNLPLHISEAEVAALEAER